MPTVINTVLFTACNSISILACLWFFFVYSHVENKYMGLRMVLVLSISDFLFHIALILAAFYPSQSLVAYLIECLFINIGLQFSIFWSCNMAFFLYRLLGSKGHLNIKNYFTKSLISLLVLSFVLPSTLIFTDDELKIQVEYISLSVICLAVIGLTAFFYFKSLSFIKNNSSLVRIYTGFSSRNIFYQSFVQLLTVGPGIIVSMVNTFAFSHLALEIVQCLTLGMAGFANTLVYFFLKRKTLDLTIRVNDSNPSNSNDNNDDVSLHSALLLGNN